MTESRPSFWDRYPWTGAILFLTLILGVGIYLAVTIGARPHYRGEWRLVSELPGQGSVAEPFRGDPVKTQVLVTVAAESGAPVNGLEVVLVRKDSGEPVSRGLTTSPGGSLLLPVPARLDPVLFSGGLEVALLTIGKSPPTQSPPPPEKGRTAVRFTLPSATSLVVEVRDAESGPITTAGRVFVALPGGVADERSAGHPLERGQVRIGGLPPETEVLVVAQVSNYPPARVQIRTPTAALGETATRLELRRLEQVASGTVSNPDGSPAGSALVALEPLRVAGGAAGASVATAMSDPDGRWTVHRAAGVERFRVVAYASGMAARAAAPSTPGSTGIALVLEKAGSFEGLVASREPGRVTVRLMDPEAAAPLSVRSQDLDVGPEPVLFSFDGIPSGAYHLVFDRPGTAPVSVRDVQVQPGVTTQDERVQPLHLE